MPPPGSDTARVAEFITQTEYRHLPQEAILAAKHGVLDWFGVAISGAREPSSKILSEYIQGMGALKESTAICQGFMTAAELAALVNGTIGHALDFDDTFANSVRYNLHPTTCVLPTAIALTESLKLSGRELLVAYIVGLEVEFRIGSAMGQLIPGSGWYPTPVLGTLGAAAAGAKALNLNPSKSQSALGIAASLAGGMKKNVGTMTKAMHAGNGARNGVVAASLAGKGFTGDPLIFEGDHSFCEQFTNRQVTGLRSAEGGLGREWMLLSAGLAFKPYPSCRATHPTIDAALHLRQKHGLRVDEITSITSKLNPLVLGMTPYHRPKTGYEAKFSMEYCIARALMEGEVSLDHFTDERVKEKEWQTLVSKINFLNPDEWGSGAVDLLTEIVIHMNDGASYSHRVAFPKGEPENPMTEGELVNKFRQCSRVAFKEDEIEKIVDFILHLEKLKDLNDFLGGLRKAHS